MNRDLAQGALCALFVVLTALAGCASEQAKPPPTAADMLPRRGPQPREEPPSRYGNGPFYEVHGRRYEVLASSAGYREQGIASWYGKKFHGKLTSSHEPYDMYALTAAHKTLPLPTWVRVTNLKNDRSVVVRVNDRGPFVANRLIDLSYAAAMQLGIVAEGTGLVEVAAIDHDDEPVVVQAAPTPVSAEPSAETIVAAAATAADDTVAVGREIYVQVGAFGQEDNARRRYALLQDGGIGPAFVQEDNARSPVLYRVRIGPIADAAEYDALVLQLQDLGISDVHLVTE